MYKTQLNLYCQKVHIPTPCYKTEKGSDDGFVSTVTFGESNSYDSLSTHSTKKAAEDEAAGVAVRSLVQRHPSASNIDEVLEQIDSPTSKKRGEKTQPVSEDRQNVPIPGNIAKPCQFANPSLQATNASMSSPSSLSARMPPPVVASNHSTMHPSQTPLSWPTVAISGVSNTLPPSIKPPPGFNAPLGLQHAPVSNVVYSPPPPASMSPQQPSYQPHVATSMVKSPLPSQIQQTCSDAHRPPVIQGLGPPPLIDTSQKPHSRVPSSAFPVRTQLNSSPPVNGSRPVATSPPPSSLSGPQATPSSPTPSLISSTSADSRPPFVEWSFHQKLEYFCRSKGLPDPNYHCMETHGKHSASVVVGGHRYSKPWQYDSFDDAKESAAMMALAYLCFEALSLFQDLHAGTPSRYTSLPTDISVPGQINQPLQHTGALPTTTTHTQLQPPSYFHQENQQTQSSAQSNQSVVQSQSVTNNTQTAPTTQQSTVAHQPNYTLQAPHFPNTDPLPLQLQSKAASITTAIQMESETTYKQALNSYCQKHRMPLSYECEAPGYTVGYIAVIHVGDKLFKSTAQSTKRAAESTAAFEALKALGVIASHDPQELPGAQMRKPPSSFGSGVSPQHQPAESGAVSYKNLLQEYFQKHGLPTPHYNTERMEEGFVSTVSVHQKSGGQTLTFTSAPCPVKKGAEQNVAKRACTELHLL